MRQLTEVEIDHLENCIPELAIHASRLAAFRALAGGHSVIQTRGTDLILVEPSGQQTVIGTVAPRKRVQKGLMIKVNSIMSVPK